MNRYTQDSGTVGSSVCQFAVITDDSPDFKGLDDLS